MKNSLTIFAMLISISVLAQDGPPQGGMGQRMREYDLKKEKTYKSTVTKVDTRELPRGGEMVIATIELDGEEYNIFIGPKEFMEKNKFSVKVGDKIEATGVLFETPRGNMLSCRKIVNGSKTLLLRDETGKPLFVREPPKKE